MDIELLSPAGDITSLQKSVMCGADAVYFGLQRFNARTKATNFDTSSLKKYIDYCHLFGVKVYIAFNIAIKQHELGDAKKDILSISQSGADGIIIADIGLFPIVNQVAPLLPIHISTQAGVHNLMSAKFFHALGADRVVLARESLSADIKDIRDNLDLDLEYFVHGALCVAFSGGCLMSSMTISGSGNRGSCQQPCRFNYTLTTNDNKTAGYMLSTADLNLSDKISELKKMGITSLKIEGRLRRAEYVAQTTLSYRKILDNKSTPSKELRYLKRTFNRGNFSKGYMFSDNEQIMYSLVPSSIGEYIGKIQKIYKKGGYSYAEITANHAVAVGDGIKVLRNGKECGGADIHSVEKMPNGNYVIPISYGVQIGDSIHITTDKKLNDSLNNIEKRLDLDIKCHIRIGEKLSITLCYNDISITYTNGYIVQQAKNASVSYKQVVEQLTKLNDTAFAIADIAICMDDNVFVPISQLNSLRRQAVDMITSKIISSYSPSLRKNTNVPVVITSSLNEIKNRLIIELQNKEQLSASLESFSHIVYHPDIYDKSVVLAFLTAVKSFCKATIYLALPKIISKQDQKIIDDICAILKEHGSGIYADNFGAVQLARENNLKYGAGIGLNIYNTNILDILYDADFAICSPELTQTDTQSLIKMGATVYVYGHIPLMTLRHCPIKIANANNCNDCKYQDTIYYNDGKGSYPTVRKKINSCTFILYHYDKRNHLFSYKKTCHNLYLNMFGHDSRQIDSVLKDLL